TPVLHFVHRVSANEATYIPSCSYSPPLSFSPASSSLRGTASTTFCSNVRYVGTKRRIRGRAVSLSHSITDPRASLRRMIPKSDMYRLGATPTNDSKFTRPSVRTIWSTETESSYNSCVLLLG